MKSVQEWVKQLNMTAHPEGGYFVELMRSEQTVESNKGNKTGLYTNIHFLLEDKNPSNFHRIASDEMWFYHDGNPLTVHIIYPDGKYEAIKLGPNDGEVLSCVVPKDTVFGSSVDSGYALVSCVVVPGFLFEEFELFKRQELLDKYPQHEDIITKLTRD
ncbi:uncharacterized protein CLIB1444_02S02762 [[Candida] jaroonii]|uniref:Uncharacterized protein n=1 Tax=[Candida] jaroonii TaxID=467808 RepID=A0ACA9Y2L5_9ASCO|nr:uncharacterized protein CLIB1444_02S02762 [[Candida] jaroonii]